MSLTDLQIESIRDRLRIANFNTPDDFDDEMLKKLVEVILDSLDIEFIN